MPTIARPINRASKTYPQWNNSACVQAPRFKEFHGKLRAEGYTIMCANVAEKDGILYWILLDDNGIDCVLEPYSTL